MVSPAGRGEERRNWTRGSRMDGEVEIVGSRVSRDGEDGARGASAKRGEKVGGLVEEDEQERVPVLDIPTRMRGLIGKYCTALTSCLRSGETTGLLRVRQQIRRLEFWATGTTSLGRNLPNVDGPATACMKLVYGFILIERRFQSILNRVVKVYIDIYRIVLLRTPLASILTSIRASPGNPCVTICEEVTMHETGGAQTSTAVSI